MDRRRRGLEVVLVARVREVRARVCGQLAGDSGDRFWKSRRWGTSVGSHLYRRVRRAEDGSLGVCCCSVCICCSKGRRGLGFLLGCG